MSNREGQQERKELQNQNSMSEEEEKEKFNTQFEDLTSVRKELGQFIYLNMGENRDCEYKYKQLLYLVSMKMRTFSSAFNF